MHENTQISDILGSRRQYHLSVAGILVKMLGFFSEKHEKIEKLKSSPNNISYD